MDAYLIELRSLGGLSGSPVFLHFNGNRRMQNGSNVIKVGGQHQFYLLGLLHGHWDLNSAIQDVITEDYSQGNKEQINTGIGIVIPAIKIWETLNQGKVEQVRQAEIKKYLIKMSSTEDINKLPQEEYSI